MVTTLVLTWVSTAFAALLNALPNPALPSWFGVMPSWLTTALTAGSQMGGWFPLTAIAASVSFLILAFGVTLALKIGRMVLSFLTLGGGSAA